MGTPNERVRVAIIGGGFSGLSLLIGLQKYPHIDAVLYESAPKFSERGAGAILGPSSQRAMGLIDPRILEGFRQAATYHEEEPDEDGMHTWVRVMRGEEPDVNGIVAEFKDKTRGATIHRAEFLEVLVKLAPPSQTKLGKKLVDIVSPVGDEDAPLLLHFKDRTFAKADIVIGADGIHSVVRKHILGTNHIAANAFFTGTIAYRSTIPFKDAYAVLGDDYVKAQFALRCGTNGLVFGFPMSQKTSFFIGVIAFNNSHDRIKGDKWNIPVDKAELTERFKNWDPFAQKLVSLVPEDGSALGWSVWEMPLAPTYVRDRVAMIGDAAHATTPFAGAGAAMAIEDPCVVSTLLGKYLDPTRFTRNKLGKVQSARLALQSYDAARRLRTQRVVVKSAELGRVYTGTEEGVGVSRDEMYRKLEGKLRWIYDGDQEEQIGDACMFFERAEFAVAHAAPQNVGRT